MAESTRIYGAWRQYVLEQEGLAGWKVVDGEPHCLLESKIIEVWTNSNEVAFLHEVAHALYPHTEGPFDNHYHGGNWAAVFSRLVNKYMEPRTGPSSGPP